MGRFYNASYDFEEFERFASDNKPDGTLNHENFLDILMHTDKTCVNMELGSDTQYPGKRLFSNRIASFIYKTDDETRVDTLLVVLLKVHRIPKKILDDIIEYFREDLNNEAIVQIRYNHKSKEFSLVKPLSMITTKVSVDGIKFPNVSFDEDIVMTIHSHNTMPAFWSSIDNLAERDEIGIFGVIGNLNNDEPTFNFRGAFNGSFLTLSKDLLFNR